MAHRVAPRAEADLDDIWLYVARESRHRDRQPAHRHYYGRFFTLAQFPCVGRSREADFGPGFRSLAVGEYVIVYCVEGKDALILRVVHGRRHLEALFRSLKAYVRLSAPHDVEFDFGNGRRPSYRLWCDNAQGEGKRSGQG